MSLVEVSPSTVIELNERFAACRSSRSRTGAGRSASVKTKASMVAMSGAIMPDPLAMPPMTTGVSPIRAVAPAPFAKVSVVRIASAAGSQASSVSDAARPGIASVMRSIFGRTPMTPVEAIAMSRARRRSAAAAALAVVATHSAPEGPVKALALPALTTSAEARPCSSIARVQRTGGAAVFERVVTPATVVPRARSTSSRSTRPA